VQTLGGELALLKPVKLDKDGLVKHIQMDIVSGKQEYTVVRGYTNETHPLVNEKFRDDELKQGTFYP